MSRAGTEDRERRAEEHHRAHDREVLRLDGVDRIASEPRDAEKRLRQEATEEELRYRRHHAGQDRDRPVLEHVAEQHRRLGEPLRAGRPNVVLVHFLEEERAIEAHAFTEAAHQRDHYRQQQDFTASGPG
jgi:hypothetical protein